MGKGYFISTFGFTLDKVYSVITFFMATLRKAQYDQLSIIESKGENFRVSYLSQSIARS